jgi:hypothetical protein
MNYYRCLRFLVAHIEIDISLVFDLSFPLTGLLGYVQERSALQLGSMRKGEDGTWWRCSVTWSQAKTLPLGLKNRCMRDIVKFQDINHLPIALSTSMRVPLSKHQFHYMTCSLISSHVSINYFHFRTTRDPSHSLIPLTNGHVNLHSRHAMLREKSS